MAELHLSNWQFFEFFESAVYISCWAELQPVAQKIEAHLLFDKSYPTTKNFPFSDIVFAEF